MMLLKTEARLKHIIIIIVSSQDDASARLLRVPRDITMLSTTHLMAADGVTAYAKQPVHYLRQCFGLTRDVE